MLIIRFVISGITFNSILTCSLGWSNFPRFILTECISMYVIFWSDLFSWLIRVYILYWIAQSDTTLGAILTCCLLRSCIFSQLTWLNTKTSLQSLHLIYAMGRVLIYYGKFCPFGLHTMINSWHTVCPIKLKLKTYTGCPRRNVQYFRRVFLMLNYTDITQNTYIQSWTVMEIMAREKCGHLAFPRTLRLQLYRISLESSMQPPLPAVIWLRTEHELCPTR